MLTPAEAKTQWDQKKLDPNFMAALRDKSHPGHARPRRSRPSCSRSCTRTADGTDRDPPALIEAAARNPDPRHAAGFAASVLETAQKSGSNS
jgi:hypothetical protein